MRYPCLLPIVLLLALPLFAASNAVPFVNQPLVPSTMVPGSVSFIMRVNGSGFARGAVVNWNGVPLATTFVNHNELKAFVPGSNVGVPGTSMVTVTNPRPGGGTSNAVPFTATLPTPSLTFATSILDVGLTPGSVVAGDFNNDGKIDLAVFNLDQPDSECYDDFGGVGTIQTFLGNGAGSFSSTSAACLPDHHGTIGLPNLVAGDFNHDGNLDLVATFAYEGAEGAIATFLGNATGAFSFQQEIAPPDRIAQPVLADFNGDGNLDLAFPDTVLDVSGLQVIFGDGKGNFDAGGTDFAFFFTSYLAVGDFNGDGILDLATASPGSAPVTILLGVGDGSFTEATTQPTTTLVSPSWITTGDFNGDGILDLAFADSGSTSLTLLLGNGDGTFTQKDGQPDAGQTTTFITTADFNGDGKLDLALVNSSNAVLIYLGNGDGTFQTPLEIGAGAGASQLAFADFNGDGRLDLAVVNSAANTVSLLLQSPAAVLSSSDVTFGPQKVGTKSQPRVVTLTNNGSARLPMHSVTASGDFSETNNCGFFQTIGHSCQIEIVFKPTESGLRTGSITITDAAADSPQVIALSGTGK
jgi:hypothetical protein